MRKRRQKEEEAKEEEEEEQEQRRLVGQKKQPTPAPTLSTSCSPVPTAPRTAFRLPFGMPAPLGRQRGPTPPPIPLPSLHFPPRPPRRVPTAAANCVQICGQRRRHRRHSAAAWRLRPPALIKRVL